MKDISRAILPLALTKPGDLERAALLLESLRANWRGATRFDLVIVSPDAAVKVVSARLKSCDDVCIQIHAETSFLNSIGFSTLPGWWKQQIIKLWVPPQIFSGYYLTFDSDIICVKPFDESTFLQDNRAITSWEDKDTHKSWWTNTYRTLGIDSPAAKPFGLSVTPNILHTELARSVFLHLDDQFGDAVQHLVACQTQSMKGQFGKESPWTEYALYTAVNERDDRLLIHHQDPASYFDGRRRILSSMTAWTQPEFTALEQRVVDEPDGFFSCIQSTISVEVSDVRQMFSAYI